MGFVRLLYVLFVVKLLRQTVDANVINVVGEKTGKGEREMSPVYVVNVNKHNIGKGRRRKQLAIYEYLCPACGCKFEVRQGYSDKALTRCPKCKTTAKRVMSIVNHKQVV